LLSGVSQGENFLNQPQFRKTSLTGVSLPIIAGKDRFNFIRAQLGILIKILCGKPQGTVFLIKSI